MGSIHLKFLKSKSLATRLFLSLDYTSRKQFHQSLNPESKNAIYEMVTEQHIKRIPIESRKAIDKQFTTKRKKHFKSNNTPGNHEDGNQSYWTAASWYFHTGDVGNSLLIAHPHLKPIFDALKSTYQEPN